MTPRIVLQEGTWPRCCGFTKHLEDKPGAQSFIKFSALFSMAQVLWRVCGQQSEWRGSQSDARPMAHGERRRPRPGREAAV